MAGVAELHLKLDADLYDMFKCVVSSEMGERSVRKLFEAWMTAYIEEVTGCPMSSLKE